MKIMEIAKDRFEYLIPIIIAFIFFFNIITMVTLQRRTEHDHLIRLLVIFIWNMCFSDLAVGLVLIINTVLHRLYLLGDHTHDAKHEVILKAMTILENAIIRLTLLVVALVLFVVTLIRIFALTKTYFRYRINRAIIININITLWILSALVVGVYNCVFEFYLSRQGYKRFEEAFIPIIVLPSVVVLMACHVLILRILQTHDLSMQTYLKTLQSYVATRTSKKKSVRNLWSATFGRSNGKNKMKVKKEDNKSKTSTNFQSKNNVIIENHYVCDTNDKRKQKMDLKRHVDKNVEQDKERCRQQVKALFSTRDISLLRFEVLVFLICWLPLALVELFHVVEIADSSWYTYSDMRQYALLIVFLKSAFTPFIYLLNTKREILCFQRTISRSTENSTLKSTTSTITTVM